MQEVTCAWFSSQHHGGHVPDDLLLLSLRQWQEPFLQPELPLATEEQQKTHLHDTDKEKHKLSLKIKVLVKNYSDKNSEGLGDRTM